MQIIQDILLFLHFTGLMLGAGGGLGSTIVQRYGYSLPAEHGAIIRGAGPSMATVAFAGTILLIFTGVSLMVMKYNATFETMPWTFWAKMAFVVTLTIASVLIHIAYGKVKKGDAGAFTLAARFGPMAGISAMAATLFAVLTFH